MQVVLFHAPPWQIPGGGEDWSAYEHGPPAGYGEPGILDPDFLSVPYGLLCIAAQAREAGHDVRVLNIANWLWSSVETLVASLHADVFGMSCLTVNRRGVAALAKLVKKHHPESHVTVGGPHVTALPLETLEYHPSIDSVSIGEGDISFVELLERLEQGRPVTGLSGMAYRDAGTPVLGPARSRCSDLDSLALPHDHFVTDTIITARGCPGKCSFCASEVLWGGKVRFHSVERVVAMFERCVQNGITGIAVKDDTFTASRKRAMAVCRSMRERKLNVLWSCDTRVDHVDDELLREMRLAGCRRLSFGVESGSPEVLAGMNKRISPEKVLRATALARRYGFEVRWYMIAGGRGETPETFRQSLDLIARGRPDLASFCMLSAFPGTREFAILQQGGLGTDVFFDNDFTTLEIFWGDDACRDVVRRFVTENNPVKAGGYDVASRLAVLERLPGLHAAHLDLAVAYAGQGDWASALAQVEQAAILGYPDKAQLWNLMGCIMAAGGNPVGASAMFIRAQSLPGGDAAGRNLACLQAWRKGEGALPSLDMDTAFRVTPIMAQPSMPVPVQWADLRPDSAA